jgi:hypothetical protein
MHRAPGPQCEKLSWVEDLMTENASRETGQATVILVFPGWSWRSYSGATPAVLVAMDRQVYFPGEVSKGFRFELGVSPGAHELTVILGGNSRTVPIEVEAGRTYEIPLKFGGRWGALKIEFPETSAES